PILAALLLIGPSFWARPLAGQAVELDESIYAVADFDPGRDPFADLKMTVERAKTEGKRILLDVGGTWCVWCAILDTYIAENTAVAEKLRESFLVMKVNYSPANRNAEFLSSYPEIPGYPHIFVLESDGSFLHSQFTGYLESGSSYSEEAVLRFLEKWAPRR
ncbi:MAG: thioredoxin family protein, partial [Gemmatimonadales bacterium]